MPRQDPRDVERALELYTPSRQAIRLKPCPGSRTAVEPSKQTEQAGVCPTCKRLVGRGDDGRLHEHFQRRFHP